MNGLKVPYICETSPALLILQEIQNVQMVMKRNARWAAASFNSYSINPSGEGLATSMGLRNATTAKSNRGRSNESGTSAGLSLHSFAILQTILRENPDVSSLDALILLQPFLDVIRSGDTSGPITAIALGSVDKFISYSLIHNQSPNLAMAMAGISSAGTHCKFEASDSAGDEVVLLKILDVLKNTLTSPLGEILSDEAVCEIMETGLSMCCQMRLSEMLRRSAERTMQTLVASVFKKLQYINAADDIPEALLESQLIDPISDRNTVDGLRMAAPDPKSAAIPAASTPLAPKDAEVRDALTPEPQDTKGGDDGVSEEESYIELRPFGLPSIRELLRVLISLLNPHDGQHTDSMRLMALSILNIAFEIGGRSIGRFPSLRQMVVDDMCKYLFQLARSDNTVILATSLRVVANVFDTMRQHLKLQQELFISYLLDRLERPSIADSYDAEASPPVSQHLAPSTPIPGREGSPAPSLRRETPLLQSEARDLLLEHLAQSSRAQDYLINLWINYDCSMDCGDLCERVLGFFSRGVYPSSANPQYAQESSQLLSLDTLLWFINHLSVRSELVSNFVCLLEDRLSNLHKPDPTSSLPLPSPETFATTKATKRTLLIGAALFNEKPKAGLKYLEENGLINSDSSVTKSESLARFLKDCPRLDKRLLGDFISRPENLSALKAFISLFNFRKVVISDAMRELLESFRLPGEAQQIARITETFAEVYFAGDHEAIKSHDAAYVLAYSVIMLNTDQHNPQNRKRMTLDDYKRNLRGVNEKSDFPPEYLKSIYDSIRRREIVMPEEHHGQLGFEYAWRELLRRANSAGAFQLSDTSIYDRDMFVTIWKPIVSALSYAFSHFQDEVMLQRVIGGFRQVSELASRYDLPEVFDFTIRSLARTTGLTSTLDVINASFPLANVEGGQTVTVSPLSIRFGTNFKAQLAAVVLCSVARNHASKVRSAWTEVFEIYQTLFLHSLLPASLLNSEDFFPGASIIPLQIKGATSNQEERRSDGGLLSTLSSYLLSPYGPGQEGIGRDVTDSDVESTLSTVDCIASCRLDDLFGKILSLPLMATMASIEAVVDLAERVTLDRIRPKAFATTNGSNSSPSVLMRTQLPYDPSSAFLLELMVSIASKTPDAISETWPPVYQFLNKLLLGAASFNISLIERAVAGLLRLCLIIASKNTLHSQLFSALHTIQALPASVQSSIADQLASGLTRILTENSAICKTTNDWNIVLQLLANTSSKEEAAPTSFIYLSHLGGNEDHSNLNSQNFVPYLHALNTVITVAGSRNANASSDDPFVARARQSLDIIRQSQNLVESLIAASSQPYATAWESYWLPLLSVYAQQSINGCRDVRQTALANLQRTLIAHEILSNDSVDLTIIFERLIFPTLDELLKPQVFRRDPHGMGETRLRASALLCKIFLHYLTSLERQGMSTTTSLWVRIIGCLDRMMHSGRRDQMYEAVPEQLKNVLLVMQAQGVLVPPHLPRTEDQAKLWDATWARIDTFLPSLQLELFPSPGKAFFRPGSKEPSPGPVTNSES